MNDIAPFETYNRNAEGLARQKTVMRAMVKRMLAHMAAGNTTDLAPEVMKVETSVYTDPARLAAERRELFLKLPALACLSCDIPKPGDFMVFEALGPSILVVRGKDGQVRAFLNSCRHRAAKVATEACGNRNRFTCPFHGWTYDNQGKLIGVPGAEGFTGVDITDTSLVAVPVQEWEGFVFVKAEPGSAAIDAEAFLGPMAAELKQLDMANTAPVRKARFDVDANWKFAQDTFFEGYHFASLHPTTIAQAAIPNCAIYDEFGPHQRVMMPSHGWTDWADKPESDWPHIHYQGIHLIFPSTIFYAGQLEGLGGRNRTDRQIFGIWRCYPGERPNQSFTLMATYRPIEEDRPEDVAEYETVSDFIFEVVEREDYSLCKQGQQNLDTSPPGHTVLFGRNEPALQSIHRHLDQFLNPAAREAAE
jgi:phenylpropionate dioxygenase-like ring-hydroxylating dioxygenase large terminal subunit